MNVLLLGLLACGSGPSAEAPVYGLTTAGLSLETATVPTVVWVRFETAEPVRATVRARFEGGERVVGEAAPTTTHALLLAGLPARTEVEVTVTADEREETAEGVVTTGALPEWVPDLQFEAEVPEEAEGGVTLIPLIFGMGGGVVGVDDAGRVVWSWPQEDEGLVAVPYRAALSLDGEAVLFNHAARSDADRGAIVRVSLDGGQVQYTDILGAHTDFAEYVDGGYLTLGWDIREVEDRRILGDTLRERSPDGVERVVWTAWDSFTPDLSRTYANLYAGDPSVEDWTHINGLSYDPVADQVYLTATFNNGVLAVDRTSGVLDWWLTDFEGGNFENADGTARLVLPHSVQAIDGGVTVFSRGSPTDPSACSFVVDIALDESRGLATETWRHEAEPCALVSYLGGAVRLAGGNTLVSWTSAGRLDEVTLDQALAWRVSTNVGAAFGFATRATAFGPGSASPTR